MLTRGLGRGADSRSGKERDPADEVDRASDRVVLGLHSSPERAPRLLPAVASAKHGVWHRPCPARRERGSQAQRAAGRPWGAAMQSRHRSV